MLYTTYVLLTFAEMNLQANYPSHAKHQLVIITHFHEQVYQLSPVKSVFQMFFQRSDVLPVI